MSVYGLTYVCGFQVDDLERDAFEVLRLVRSIKNSLAPINRIPLEVLSLIPSYCPKDDEDEQLVTLTHVCRGWRNMFVSHPPLWTRLDFMNIDQTRTYIQRSQSSPLHLHLDSDPADDVFAPVIPHINRLKSLTINAFTLPSVLTHIHSHAPLLEALSIGIHIDGGEVLDGTLFNGDISSLRELHLRGVTLPFSLSSLSNLRVLALLTTFRTYSTTEILDLFEVAPLLHRVHLQCSLSDSSDAPPKRIVSLHHLKNLTIDEDYPPYSILFRHLQIPAGVSLVSDFEYNGDESPFLDYLPERSPNFNNLSHITTINLLFGATLKSMRLSGPSGSLCVFARWGDAPSLTRDHQVLRSLCPMLPTIEKLFVSDYEHKIPGDIEECPVFKTLSSTNNLRTLTLNGCNQTPFIFALDPEQNPSNLVLCPNMEELVIYARYQDMLHVKELFSMAKNRASRGVKLSSITISHPHYRRREALKLREYVAHVEYKPGSTLVTWDYVPDEIAG
jgi:hypothetical protein